jgi:hypothetical protein
MDYYNTTDTYNTTTDTYNITTETYNITTKILRKYYRSTDLQYLHITTRHYSHYSHYRFRGKVTKFADVYFILCTIRLRS